MEKRILAICDKEEKYAYRLMEALKARRDFGFEIFVFTDVEKLLLFGKGKKAIECLLIAESTYIEEVKELGIPHTIFLNESGVRGSDIEFHFINKYQTVDGIVNEVLLYYSNQENDLPPVGGKGLRAAKLVGVYSPIRRCLQTTFSLTLGQILAKNYRTLYINYETFSGFEKILGKSYHADVTDMAYLFECVREKFLIKLRTITEQINGLDIIPPATVYPDLMSIPGSIWTAMLKELKEQGSYDYIILDLTDYINGLLNILQECTQIYTITRGDYFAVAKLEQYEEMLRGSDYLEVTEKTRKLNLPIFKNIAFKSEEMTYSELAVYIRECLLDELVDEW